MYESKKSSLPPLGFIATKIHFHRPAGDPFNQQTWDFPIIRVEADESTEEQVVTNGTYTETTLNSFVEAGRQLAAQGCVGIITSCGFLAAAQPILASLLPVPVATSSLLQLRSILAILPPQDMVGVLTYDEGRLGNAHLTGVGLLGPEIERIYIKGAPSGGHLQRMVQRKTDYIHEKIENELVKSAEDMIAARPAIKAILLECTQMPPFAPAIQNAVRLPIYDVYSLGCWFYDGLCRKRPIEWGPIHV